MTDVQNKHYDAQIGRFSGVAPRAEWYYSLTPYQYAGNNPITQYDVNGEFIGTIVGAVVGAGISAIRGENVWKGALSGAAGGAVFDAIYTGGASLAVVAVAGMASGAVANGVDQAWDIAAGDQKGFSGGELAMSTAAGGVLAPLGGAVANRVGKFFRGVFRKGKIKVDLPSEKIIPGADEGVIYKVSDPAKTNFGKPYVGSANDLSKRAATATDGRDRTGAEIIGVYKKGDRLGRRIAEQEGINRNGGKARLDNKRNEVKEADWTELGINPPNRTN